MQLQLQPPVKYKLMPLCSAGLLKGLSLSLMYSFLSNFQNYRFYIFPTITRQLKLIGKNGAGVTLSDPGGPLQMRERDSTLIGWPVPAGGKPGPIRGRAQPPAANQRGAFSFQSVHVDK